MEGAARSAVYSQFLDSGRSNPLADKSANFTVDILGTTEVDWTTEIGLFITDLPRKPFLFNQEGPPELLMKDENSDFAQDNWAVEVTATNSLGFTYGEPLMALKATFG